MKLRLAHLLFVVFFAQMSLATIGMGTLMAWNLRHGFSEYLQSNDQRRLKVAAGLAEDAVASAGGLDDLRAQPHAMKQIMDAEADHEGIPMRERVDAAPGRPLPSPRRGPGQEFGGRVGIFLPDGRQILGPPLPQKVPFLAEPVHYGGKTVAFARAYAAPVPHDAERGFLKRQYVGLGLLGAALLALSFFVSLICARALAQPLEAMSAASRAFAGGDFNHCVPGSAVAEVDETARSLSGMAQTLATLDATRRRWLAQMSHELRTPITVLRGELELLGEGIRKPTADAIKSLLEETLRLGRLIEDLHLLAVSDAGRLPMHFAETNALSVTRRAVDRFQRQAKEKGLDLALVDGPEDLSGQWDEARLDQIMANLVGNAIAYTDAPGTIRIGLTATPDAVIFTVEDTSPAPPLHENPAGASTHYSGGAGLGLKICENLARAHGGYLTLAPSVLGGLRAELVLPMATMEAA